MLFIENEPKSGLENIENSNFPGDGIFISIERRRINYASYALFLQDVFFVPKIETHPLPVGIHASKEKFYMIAFASEKFIVIYRRGRIQKNRPFIADSIGFHPADLFSYSLLEELFKG